LSVEKITIFSVACIYCTLLYDEFEIVLCHTLLILVINDFFNHICQTYLQHLQDLQYKAAWKAGQWDETLLTSQKDLSHSQAGFHQSIYLSMSSLFGDGSEDFGQTIRKTRVKCVE